MLTICTFKWQGWRGNMYRACHVRALKAMLDKHMSAPFRFVCVTDDRRGLDGIETVKLWGDQQGLDKEVMHRPHCYKRMRLFSDDCPISGPILHMDLDCIVCGDLDPLIPPPGTGFKVLKGHVADYNGSLWYIEPGYRPDVWEDLTQDNIDRAQDETGGYGSDQVWLSHKLPGHDTWSAADGVHQYHTDIRDHGDVVPPGARVIFFAGPKKPWKSGLTWLYNREKNNNNGTSTTRTNTGNAGAG